ncbi:sodium-dependent glucose transporter 1-like protein [Leptotrombidium deliense]|uniref:Sodium-dependent glucose transporter 1-like protein n=1 Tax=Leptotrombidium deliense TaxID=299467 RepID=A0A443S4T4_9ACAR|nr:sodium-dependent glucose transporter 1-like protein [Leptotrombidium deliense]
MLFWEEIKAHKYRFLKTCVLYASFIFLGAYIALPGATLLDLQIAVNVGIEKITYILPARSAGHALGAFTNTLIVDKLDTQITLLLSIETVLLPYTPSDLKIPYSYSIVSAIAFFVFVMFLCVYVRKRDNKPHPSRQKDSNEKKELKIPTFTHVCIVATTSMFMLIYCGLELIFGTLLLTYAVKCDLALSKPMAAYLTSTYWGGFTFFRLFVVLIVEKVGCQNLLLFDIALIALSNVILVPFGNTNLIALWIGVTIMGIGTSSVFGAVFGFLEDFVTVTGRMTSTFMVSVCFGEFILPFLVGKYVDAHPIIFLYITLFCTIMLIVTFFILMILKYKCLRLKKSQIPEISISYVAP